MEWKQIEDYPDYFVSNIGLVRNKRGKILSPRQRNGYLSYGLYLDKKMKQFNVHRLVALAFIPNPNNKLEVDHINRDKQDNRVENLRFATRSENNSNRRKKEGGSSIFKGVRFNQGHWTATVKRIHLGFYKTEREAGQAYNTYILENHLEEFYSLNEV